MGRRLLRRARGGAAALLSLSGLLVSCSSTEFSANRASAADSQAADSRIEVADTFGIPDLEERFEAVARSVAPSVVAISATDAHIEADDAMSAGRINVQKLAAMLDPVDRTVGTGFVVDPEGYIVTNDHVVSANDNIWVTTDDHHVYPAIVVGSDPRSDLAVLKIPAHHLPCVRFSDAPARRGQWTLALGNPYGLAGRGDMALSVGVVSATNRSLPKLSSKEDRLYSDLIQTTAQINPGNSGGPLFDARGEVIGINAAVILPQKGTNGIGFAIPVSARIRSVISELEQGNEVVYGWLGVRVDSPTAADRKAAGIVDEAGARIEEIDGDSPAAHAGLHVGDVVVRFDGQDVLDSDQFVKVVGESPVDKTVEAIIYRNGCRQTLSVASSRRHSQQAAVTRLSQRLRWRGMLLGPSSPANGAIAAASTGLVVLSMDPGSPFAKDYTTGAIITNVAGHPVKTLLDLQQILNETPPEACAVGWAKAPEPVVSARE